MATFGISIPDEIKEELDQLTESWYTDRSKAIIRIYQEWKELRRPHLSIVPNEMEDRFPPTEFEEAA